MSDPFMKSYGKARQAMGYAKNKDQFSRGFQSPPKAGSKAARPKANAQVPIREAKRSKSRNPRNG